MASKRPSVQKREREQKKRDRRIIKAARAAERRALPPSEGEPVAVDGSMARKDDESC